MGVVVLCAPALTGGAVARAAAACGPASDGEAAVAVVVDDGVADPLVRCVLVPDGASGRTVLLAAGIPFRVGSGTAADGNQGGFFVCGILGQPASGCATPSGGGTYDYWAYYRQPTGAAWTYSRVGFDARLPSRCSVQGWRRVRAGGVASSANLRPRPAPPIVRCPGDTAADPPAPVTTRPVPTTRPAAPPATSAARPAPPRAGPPARSTPSPGSGAVAPSAAPTTSTALRPGGAPAITGAAGVPPAPEVRGVTTVAPGGSVPAEGRPATGAATAPRGPSPSLATAPGPSAAGRAGEESAGAESAGAGSTGEGLAAAATDPAPAAPSAVPWGLLGGLGVLGALVAVAGVRARRSGADR